jgi:hypothetical protein
VPAKVERIPSYISAYPSGNLIDLFDMKPEDIEIEDVAHHLALQCRWSGAVRYHYSVAQHAWHCSFLVPPDHAYDALHHDDAEYILQDMAKPLKHHILLGRGYRVAEAMIEKVIGPALDVRFPLSGEVKVADLAVLCAEADQLTRHGRTRWTYYKDIAPAPIKVKRWTPEKAERKWLARHEELKDAKNTAS